MDDPGDYYDELKWDFPENLPVYEIDGYEYMATSKRRAQYLAHVRNNIDQLCSNLEMELRSNRRLSKLERDRIQTFLDIHQERYYDHSDIPAPFSYRAMNAPTSMYLLGEIPKFTGFQGINKPRMRVLTDLPPVGKDGQGRALYRHIFLNLDANELDDLIIHELAHSMANHIQWRNDDHHADFKWCENMIKKYY